VDPGHLFLADVDAVPLLRLVRQHRREQPHRVLGLLARDGRGLYPRLRVVGADRVTVSVDALDAARAERLVSCKTRTERVLAVAFEPLQHAVSTEELSALVGGVPPQQKPSLFVGPDPRLTAGLLEVDAGPAEHLPAERMLRQQPVPTVGRALPRRADRDRRESELLDRGSRSGEPLPVVLDYRCEGVGNGAGFTPTRHSVS